MPSEEKGENSASKLNRPELDLPFALFSSFANITEIPLKLCGTGGQLIPGAPAMPAAGPCAVLNDDNVFCESCADNHAAAATMAIEIRRPYIYNCHMRLASWAIPILQNNEPLPAVIICGGVLLSEPDIALKRHMESAAGEYDLGSDKLMQSLDSVPVFSREHIRAVADFLFRMASAFASYASLPGASEIVAPPPEPDVLFDPVIITHSRIRETRKARLERAGMLERQNVETEIVRLLRDRKPEAAQGILLGLLKEEKAPSETIGSRLNMAETLTRLFRHLIRGTRVSVGLQQKQSRLITDVLTRPVDAEQACKKFILIAEETTGEPRPRKIKAIQKHIERNLARKLTLGTVGGKFDLKEKSLDALIRKHCGIGFTDYVVSLRVSECKRLLLTTDLSMAQIARKTGFKDQSYFTKVFKSRLGSTPTEFRLMKAEAQKGRTGKGDRRNP